MLKRIFMMVILLSAVTQLVLSEDLFRILEDTPVWNSPPLTDSRATIIIPKGSLISSVPAPYRGEVNGIPSFAHTSIIFGNTSYYIAANTFTAKDTEEIFDETFLTSADPQSKIWINAYFLDVMRTGNRDIIIPHEQRHVDDIRANESVIQWYEVGAFEYSLVITQGTISIGGLIRDQFWIRRIEHIQDGYCVTVTWNTQIPDYLWDTLLRSMKINLPERRRGTVLYLYFVIDGDYLDVYYKEDIAAIDKTYCTTYALVDFEIRQQIGGIIYYLDHYNTHPTNYAPYDLSKITFWPRRADGSMDYPHPLDRSNDSALNRTIEENYPLLNTDNAAAGLSQADDFIQSGKSSQSLPLWALIAIIGGVVVLAGGVVLFIVKRKR
ncbi:MAG: hypothetical protein LBI28_01735 [Treponema sp.]|nr:hypothetical protein [Treponema sp.]